jgi:hypothetical protein
MIGFEKPSLVFYSEQHIQFFNLRSQAIDYIYEHQKESNDTILVIGKDNFLDDFSANHPQVQILTEGFPYKLVRLSKATPPR